ncbi:MULTISPECIES: SDR family NAD(P)-dependent oxidoreductase [unclassified Mesorhizobium]|uniref:SDR family NAD(P)-dependent oxidoreductase n=1 Tax=unclassified Mesorhizobium TaxID=325217 RepID=UPI0009DC9A9F|nr:MULTISPECIES: SDR family oxidoreductase [unclassified Mesorhizobium]
MEGLAATAAAVRKEGATPVQFEADVTQSQHLRQIVGEVERAGDRIGNVVACAGVAAVGSVVDMDEASFDRIIAVNLKGMFLLAKCALPHLMQGAGGFVAIASDAGTQGAQGYAAYCASKHAVVGLIKCMALDHGPQGVRNNAICPGFVETPMPDRLFSETPDDRSFYAKAIPLGRFARPDDVAELASFLTSPESAYINGAILAIDGGSTAGYFSAPPS